LSSIALSYYYPDHSAFDVVHRSWHRLFIELLIYCVTQPLLFLVGTESHEEGKGVLHKQGQIAAVLTLAFNLRSGLVGRHALFTKCLNTLVMILILSVKKEWVPFAPSW